MAGAGYEAIMRAPLAFAALVLLLAAADVSACEDGSLGDGVELQAARIARAVSDEHDKGEIRLETYIYRPKLPGRLPTILYSHGSTGAGQFAAKAKAYPTCEMVRFFTERGYALVAPNRRGRGDSTGTYVEECFGCNPRQYYAVGVRGLEEGLKDLDAAFAYTRALPFVDPARIVLAGQSRGGFLSVLYAGQHPDRVRGVVNFSGGWFRIAPNQPPESVPFMTDRFRQAGERYGKPMLWLYREGDARFPPSSINQFYESFRSKGGKGSLRIYGNDTGRDGHFFVNAPALWTEDIKAYLNSL